MSRHRDRTHHRPMVHKARGNRSKWSYPWKAECECGWNRSEMYWRSALIDSLIHAGELR